MFGKNYSFIYLTFLIILSGCSTDSKPCKFDTDCKEDKVCRNGICMGIYENIDIKILEDTNDIKSDTFINDIITDTTEFMDYQINDINEIEETSSELCISECDEEGKRECAENGYIECKNVSQSGICLKKVFSLCENNQECRNGYCDFDECSLGERKCIDTVTYKICEEVNGFLKFVLKKCDVGFLCYDKLCCPSDMIEVEGFCIDKYEAIVSLKGDCSSDIFGQNNDDYPNGFPDNVDLETNPPSVLLYTCSKEGVLPSRFITFYQANTVCKLSGKRLCTKDEFIIACTGNKPSYKYPYGEKYNQSFCNDFGILKEVSKTGSFENCMSSYHIYDMSGNVAEWILPDQETNTFYVIGGNAGCNYPSPNGCSECSTTIKRDPLYYNNLIGFRCCK